MPWRTFVARLVVGSIALTLAVFAGVRLASAVPGGPTRDALTYSGVLRERAGMANTRLTFVFNRGGGAARCTTTTDPFTPDSSGAFSVLVLLSGSGCPNARSFFDGDDVQFDVRLGDATGEVIASNVPVTPVPYARFADQAGVNNDCPAGYTRDTTDTTVRGGAGVILCRRGRDEIVRVGDGAGAFWIDRYESTVWSSPEGGGTVPANSSADDLPSMNFPKNGQWLTVAPAGTRPRSPWFAVSIRGAFAPASNVTWFQANALCLASGKRLPSGREWIVAAQGSPDDSARCNVAATGVGRARSTGAGDACASLWGAQEMVGNVTEWTDEWYSGIGNVLNIDFSGVQLVDGGVRPASMSPSLVQNGVSSWGPGYGGDYTYNVNAFTLGQGSETQQGVPAAALRGGNWTSIGDSAGIYALGLATAPSSWHSSVGFRCVVPR
jgi:formylglycine-generating enzyme required for sulfatase activity